MKAFIKPANPLRAAIFMSGTGTNAEVLLRNRKRGSAYEIALLVTDAPETSRARELGKTYHVPVAACDIRQFYRERGEEAIALTSDRRRQLRDEWTDVMRREIAPYRIDFVILAGFIPLTNLTSDLPCLNVHPGDLTLLDAGGRRMLAGLHIRPVEHAILAGHAGLRSSVILAQPYTGSGDAEMDSGPLLGISAPVPVELDGHTLDELRAIAAARIPGDRNIAHDPLRKLALKNLEKLKFDGDHVVFPAVIEAFAAGNYRGDGKRLFFRAADGEFHEVKTVEFGRNQVTPLR